MSSERKEIHYGFPTERHEKFPAMVLVGNTNVCNLDCIHCYHRTWRKHPEYRPTFLEEELVLKILREVGEHPGTVLNIACDGEPFVDKRLPGFLEVAKDLGISPITTNTNGTLLTEELCEAILERPLLDIVNVSIDAASEETYKRIRGGDYRLVLENTLRLVEMRDRKKSKTKLMVNIIDQPEAADEVEEFVKFWEPKVDRVLVRHYVSSHGLVHREKEDFAPVERWPCKYLFFRLDITHDGIARYCGDDWLAASRIGDIRTHSIAEIWSSPEYKRIRKAHLEGAFDEVKLCDRCTEWQSGAWDYDYFHAMRQILDPDQWIYFDEY